MSIARVNCDIKDKKQKILGKRKKPLHDQSSCLVKIVATLCSLSEVDKKLNEVLNLFFAIA